jgi:hypothetical protein
MLLLDDADHLDLARILEGFRCLVPPGHVHSAARSPGGEDVQDHLPAPELGDRSRTAVVECRQSEGGKRLPDGERTGRRRGRLRGGGQWCGQKHECDVAEVLEHARRCAMTWPIPILLTHCTSSACPLDDTFRTKTKRWPSPI